MTTKKAFLFTGLVLAFLMFAGIQVNGQKVELSPFIGYETGANIWTNVGELHIDDGMNYGGSLDVGIGGGRYGEFSYSHMASSLSLQGVSVNEIVDLNVDYYSFGILQEMKPDAKASPYGLFSLGWVNYRPTGYSNENKMHISLAGGVKIRASEKIGLRLQARLLMPLYYAGTYFSAGTGGAGYGVSGGIVGVQGDFTAALVFMLK